MMIPKWAERLNYLTLPVKIGDICFDVLPEDGVPLKGIVHSSYKSHTHTANEIYFIENGSLALECDGEQIELNSGEIFIMKPRVSHHIIRCTEDLSRFSLRFSLSSQENVGVGLPKTFHYVPTAEEKNEIFASVNQIRNLTSGEMGMLEAFRLKSHYGILLSYSLDFLNIECKEENLGSYSRLALYTRIEGYFDKNCNTQITLESLANYLSYSKAQTNRILNECYGTSFSQILRNTRIGVAKRLLAESSVPINEIAARCGYDTRQGFELMFTKYVGLTPHAFREQYFVVHKAD